jgi:tetratricopeptide (TPR) repeat protein
VATEGLAFVAAAEGDPTAAQELYGRAYSTYVDLFGPTHSHSLRMRWQTARLLWIADENLREAERELRKVMEASISCWGMEHYLSLNPMWDLARLLDEKGEYAQAQELLSEVARGAERTYGPEHPSTFRWRSSVGDQHARMHRWESAFSIFLPMSHDDPAGWEAALKAGLSGWLSGDPEHARGILEAALTRLQNQTDSPIRPSIAEAACLMFREPSQFQPYAQLLATRVSTNDPARMELIHGLTAMREGDFRGAVQRLTPLREQAHPYEATQPIAGMFAAISLARLGHPESAGQLLREAQETIEAQLVDGRWPHSWCGFACCLLAQREAEEAVLGTSRRQSADGTSWSAPSKPRDAVQEDTPFQPPHAQPANEQTSEAGSLKTPAVRLTIPISPENQ